MALTTERIRELYQEVQRRAAQLDAADQYSFGGWFPIAVELIEAEARRAALEEAAQLVEKSTYLRRWAKAAVNGQARNVPPCELAASIRKLKEDTQ